MSSLNKNQWINLIGTIALVGTLVFIIIRFYQQRDFHIDAFRAWVNIEPKTTIEVKKNSISYKIDNKNYGESPAFNCHASAEILLKDHLLQRDYLCGGKEEGYTTLFPDKNYPILPEHEIEGYSGNYTKAEITELIKKEELYLFSSVSYEDFSNEKRYFSIFQLIQLEPYVPTPDPQREKPNIIHIRLKFIKDSQERCIKVPKLN